jgi:hypothetical protein
MTTVKACMFCLHWKQDRNPLRKEFGICRLAEEPSNTLFRALIQMDGSECGEGNKAILQTRTSFYCAGFRSV